MNCIIYTSCNSDFYRNQYKFSKANIITINIIREYMMEVRDNAEFCTKHNREKKGYRCNECQDKQMYCSECYIQHLNIKHSKTSPIRISDEVEKRILRIENNLEGENEGNVQLREFEMRAREMKQELDGLLKEGLAITEKKKNDMKKMLWEAERCGAETGKYAEQLDIKIRAAELGYRREKSELQAIRGMKNSIEAEKASIRVENEVCAMLWLKGDAIKGAIRELNEATAKLKRTYSEIQAMVIAREDDMIMREKIGRVVSKFASEQLEECKRKIEQHFREGDVGEKIRGLNNMIRRYREELARFGSEKNNQSGILGQPDEKSAANVKNRLGEKKKEPEQEEQGEKEETKIRLDKLASEKEKLKSLKRKNEQPKDDVSEVRKELQKFQYILREKIAEDERYAEVPKMASSIYTHYYPRTGGKVVYLYNTVTRKVSNLTFDYAHPENYSSTIIVRNNLQFLAY